MKLRFAMLSGTAVLALLTTGTAVAQAHPADTSAAVRWSAPTNSTVTSGPSAQARATGNFYGWRDAFRGGGGCAWPDDDDYLGNDCGGMNDTISSAFNDSSQGNVVRLYIHSGYAGAYACLGPGDGWDDFQGVWFSFRPGLDGYTQNANDQVSSFTFNHTCS